jgi:hypothetical protein
MHTSPCIYENDIHEASGHARGSIAAFRGIGRARESGATREKMSTIQVIDDGRKIKAC